MHKSRVLGGLAVLLLLLLGAKGTADTDPAELECISDQPYDHWLEGEEASSKGAVGVPRNQVLLEIFTKPSG